MVDYRAMHGYEREFNGFQLSGSRRRSFPLLVNYAAILQVTPQWPWELKDRSPHVWNS